MKLPVVNRLYYQLGPLMRRVGPIIARPGIGAGLARTAFQAILNFRCTKSGAKIQVTMGTVSITKDGKVIKIGANHWIYAPTLARDFDAYFNGVIPHQEGKNLVVDFSKCGLQTFSISKLQFEISGFPEEEETIRDYFRWYVPRPGDTVFDLGGNCGVSAYYLSQAVGPAGKVCVFEPDPANFAILLRNVERHKLTNVIPVKKAVAASAGQMKFFSEGTVGSILAQFSNRPTTGRVVTVETVTLAGACETYGVPSFVKVDVEGAEIEIIASAEQLLRKHCIQFAVDTNHWIEGELTASRVEKLFRGYGYETLSADDSGFMTTWARKATAP